MCGECDLCGVHVTGLVCMVGVTCVVCVVCM